MKTFHSGLLKLLETSVEKNMPVLLVGHTGVGKTTLIREVAKVEKKQLHRINLTGQTGVDEIVGKYIVGPKKHMEWVDGLLIKAMREGHWVVLDEINMALPEILAKLHSLLDDDRMIVLVEKDGEIVLPHKDFRIFGTMNPSTEYAGTKELNRAFLSRFPIVVEVNESDEEVGVVAEQGGISIKDATSLVMFAKEIRSLNKQQQITFYAAKLMSVGFPVHEALIASIISKAPSDERDTLYKISDLLYGVITKIEKLGHSLTDINNLCYELDQATKKSQEGEAEKLALQKENENLTEYKLKYVQIKGI